jgi:hypothetical protein
VYGHDRQAIVALDDDMGSLLPQLDAAARPKKPEQILAGQTFVKFKVAGECVKSIDISRSTVRWLVLHAEVGPIVAMHLVRS